MRPVNVTVIHVYAPTTTHSEEELDTFYDQLQTVKDGLRTRDICVVMGEFNAKAGDDEDRESGVGKYGLGTRNENGERLASFCKVNELILTNTCFKHRKRNMYTWLSPDGNTINQIYYIAIDKGWFSSILDAKSYPGADGDSDHNLVLVKMRLKTLKIRKKEETPLRFDLNLFAEQDVRTSFAVETENRF